MNSLKNIMQLLSSIEFKNVDYQLIGISFRCIYNDEHLYKIFEDFVSSHAEKSSFSLEIDFSFGLICEDELYDLLEKDLPYLINKGNQVLSYCSNEKGMLRVTTFEDAESDYKIYKTQKTPSFLVCGDCKYYYIISSAYLNNISFKKDAYKFFEHIFGKISNVKGTVLLHGATAISPRGKGVMIIGPKRSGKTTVLLDMIHEANYLPVSVDKTYVLYKDHSYIANGFPTRMRVLAGTLLKYGNEFIKYVPHEYKTATKDILWKGESNSKVDLTGEAFLKFCNNTPIKKSTCLDAILLPDIRQDNTVCVRPATSDEIFQRLIPQIFTPINPEEDWWSNIGKNNDDINQMLVNRDRFLKDIITNQIPILFFSAAENLKDAFKMLANDYNL